MRSIDVIQRGNNRNQALRLLMLTIVVGTFPFYCLGVIIIGSAPSGSVEAVQQETEASNATFTPLGADITPSMTPSPQPTRYASPTPVSILRPTPWQFIPPPAAPTAAPTDALAQTSANVAPPVNDSDGDGVADEADGCPDEFGYVDNRGCPYPDDPDRDGLRGDADLCPNEYAPYTPRGCQDADNDGLDTSQDDCPHQAGTAANRGCP